MTIGRLTITHDGGLVTLDISGPVPLVELDDDAVVKLIEALSSRLAIARSARKK